MELRIQNLSITSSNGVRALHDVSLTIPSGMFGLLGPSGASKTNRVSYCRTRDASAPLGMTFYS